MYETQAVFYKPTHLQAGQNPELKTLFFKLAQMLNSCAVPIFVFDGPDQPLVKRDHEVRVMPPWLKMDFERLIDAFGFFSHQVREFFSVHAGLLDVKPMAIGTWRS